MEPLEEGSTLYRFVGKQSKMCLRKGLKIAKQLFNRFAFDAHFTQRFSALLYTEVIEDQLPVLKERYISEKSQVVEILTLAWSQHANCLQGYLSFPQVLPKVLAMLQSVKIDPDNVQLILAMLKNIVQASLGESEQTKKRMLTTKMETDVLALHSDSDSDGKMQAAPVDGGDAQ